MKSWTSAFSVSSPIAALDERWMQPGWCGAAPGPRGFPFPSRPAPPRLASPRAARAAAASHCWLLLPGPRDPSPAPRPGEGAGAERSRLGGSGPAQPAASSWLGPSPAAGQERDRGGGGVSQSGRSRLAQVGEASLGDEDPNSAHRRAGRILGSRCTTLRIGCLRASMLTRK